jgi:hypothetical protein
MSDKAPPSPEKFTAAEHLVAVVQFIQYGEKTRVPDNLPSSGCSLGHKGYYSGIGWAARALKSLRDHLNKPPVERIVEEMRQLTDSERYDIITAFCFGCGAEDTSCPCQNDD